jgi:hypothetical protein
MVVELPSVVSAGQWVQSIRCQANKLYRIEVTASVTAAPRTGGVSLSMALRSFAGEIPVPDSKRVSAAWRSSKPAIQRVLYKTPRQATRLELAVRVTGSAGAAVIHSVRAMPMDFHAVEAHPLATPPPPFGTPPPKTGRTLMVADDGESAHRLCAILKPLLGPTNVRVCPRGRLPARGPDTDALILTSTKRLRTDCDWRAVGDWARERIVVVSLDVFAELVNRRIPGCVNLKTCRQEDDTLGARVACADFITSGLALQDAFEFGIYDGETAGFRQRQLLRTAALRKFLHAEDIVTTLVSETSMDESTGRPLALFKRTEGGGVLAMDLDPLLTPTGLEEQANPTLVMLGNLLGRGGVGLGQFADPLLSLEMRRRQYAAADGQCPGLDVYWMTPEGRVWREAQKHTEPVLVAASRGESSGLAGPPAVVVRTGFDKQEQFAAEGVFCWLKNLRRMEPYGCRYAARLLGRRQVAFVPRGMRVAYGHLRKLLGGAPIELVIDVHPGARNEVRLLVPERDAASAGYFELLPELDRQLRCGRGFGWLPAAGAELSECDAYGWRHDALALEVSAARQAFSEGDVGAFLADGAQVLRLEVPGHAEPSAARSILETDRLATLLELIGGLELGVVAVNRGARRRKLALGSRFPVRSAWLVTGNGTEHELSEKDLGRLFGQGITLEPGMTLIAER